MNSPHHPLLQRDLALQALLWRMEQRAAAYRLPRIARARELGRGAKRH